MTASTERIRATYLLDAPEADIEARAKALAVEQSVEMPVEAIADRHVLEDVVARVESIRPREGIFEVVLAIACSTTGPEASQLLNMLFGNCSLQPEVELVDVEFPRGYERAFPGPRFGIEGIREMVRAEDRALTCTAFPGPRFGIEGIREMVRAEDRLKPQGSGVAHLASLAGIFARAGIDVVKDDHGIANQADQPFAERVPAVQRAIHEANRETGGSTVYAPTFSGSPRALEAQARIARECGVRMALAAPMLLGVPAFVEMQVELDIPVMAHPAFGGATRIAPPLLLGKLFRLFGADATIFPNHGGRFSYSRATCLAIADAARRPWNDVKAALPVPAGGMTVERVPEMLAGYGADTMLLIGGGLLVARERLPERAKEFVAAVRR